LWISLLLGALMMLAILGFVSGADTAARLSMSFGGYLLVGLPAGLIFGAIVFGILAAIRALTHRRLVRSRQVLVYGVSAFLVSGLLAFGFLSLFPFSFSIQVFALVTGVAFGGGFALQAARLVRSRL
jgi:hypothetical protein